MVRKASTRTVAPVAAKRPLAGYLRLTVDRQGNKIGYDVQQKAIEKWAEYAGETIGHWYRDKDITAADRTKERPEYEQMLADVEAGTWGGIVVWRLDRLVRLMFEIERCFRLTEDVGAFLVSIDPAVIDSRDPLGKIFMRILVMFAEMEIDTMKARARGHRNERASKGMYNGGGARPYGFVGPEREDPDDPESKILNSGQIGIEHVPEEVAHMREAAQRIGRDGEGWADVIADWHARTPPVYGATGKPWSVFALQRVLTGPRAIGMREAVQEDPETGEQVPYLTQAVWEPVLDRAIWEKLNSLLTSTGSSGPKHTYLLSGWATCGRCSHLLTGARRKYHKGGEVVSTKTYRCKSGPEDKVKGSCGSLSVLAAPVEKLVVARVLQRLSEAPDFITTLAGTNEAVDVELKQALQIIAECDDQLEQVARVGIALRWTDRQFEAAQMELDAKKSAATHKLDAISRRLAVPIPTADDQKDLIAWFGSLTLTQQRALLRAGVRSISVRATGRSGPRFDESRVVVVLADAKQPD